MVGCVAGSQDGGDGRIWDLGLDGKQGGCGERINAS